ncbi:MAG: metallophosphoesterase [Treponema sp.]|jgi:alkaline phosphatase|nr:metallophosphoesterase [Treponema sp.]
MGGTSVVLGIFTDTHYSRKPDDGERFFQNSLDKMKHLTRLFRKRQVDLTFCLGDLIDKEENDKDAALRLEELLTVWKTVSVPIYLCPGNHDISALPREDFFKIAGLPCSRAYRSFDYGGVHFIILDTNHDKEGRAYTPRTMRWDECYIDPLQLEWLKADLKNGSGPALVFSHANLDPRFHNGELDPHVVKNHEEVRSVLVNSRRVQMVLQGHYHKGRQCIMDEITYFTLPAVVEGKDKNYGLILRCGSDRPLQWEELFR